MIGTPTTFVVGAGASCDHGIPAGQALRDQAATLNAQSDIFQTLLAGKIPVADLDRVLGELRADEGATSIDAFLESRQHRPECMRVGRALIALLIGQAMATAPNVRPSTDDWLGFIIRRMREGAATCRHFVKGNHGVRFVTFNFDSRIEERLQHELPAIFPDASREELESARRHFEVIHVHGKLPVPPNTALRFDSVWGVSDGWLDWLATAVDQVRVVHDDIDKDTVTRARNAVAGADIVCFLGCAYARENVKRLGFPEVIQARKERPMEIFGSTYRMTESARSITQRRVPGIEFSRGKCVDLLEERHVCRD